MEFTVSTVNLINLIISAAGIGVCALCFLHITVSENMRKEVRRFFQSIFLMLLLYICAHLARQLMEGLSGSGIRTALYIAAFFEGLSAGFLTFFMSMLVLNVVKRDKRFKLLELALVALITVHAAIMIFAVFTNTLYYFDDGNFYHRAPAYLLSSLSPFVMLIINSVLLIRFGQNIDRRVRLAFWIYMIAPLLAIFIQSIFYGIQYIIFATVAASVYMYFVIIRNQRVQSEKNLKSISRLQNGLILVLADLVESRDKCTGDHVRKTAEYSRIIMKYMRKNGYYKGQLTDAFIEDVVRSAPLHDVGKIQVPDAILNKPGKLTAEEFEEIKVHTTAGRDIITNAIDMVSEETSGYLNEARNLAYFHHERWDGKGYPQGLSGEEIPLSARIMAVADVFDALISKRSYKDGLPFERAMEIIREGSGTHFDPKVAEALLQAEDEVRAVACTPLKP